MKIATGGGVVEVKSGTNGIYLGLHDGATGTALVIDDDAALAIISHLATATRSRFNGQTIRNSS